MILSLSTRRIALALTSVLGVANACSLSQLSSGGARSNNTAGSGGVSQGGSSGAAGGISAQGGVGAGGKVGIAGAANNAAGATEEGGSGGEGGEGGMQPQPLPTPPYVIPRWACNTTNPYHVSSSGSDSNVGSAASPFATVQHAISVMAAGDELIIHAGVYQVPSALNLDWAGSPTTPTCIIAAPDEAPPVLDGGSTPDSDHTPGGDSDLINIHGTYVVLNGLSLHRARSTAVDSYKAQSVDLLNLQIEDAWEGAVSEEASGSDVRVAGSSMTGNCQINSDGSKGGQCHTVAFRDINDTLEDSVVARNYGTGVCLINATYMLVQRNTFIDNSNWHIKLENPGDATLAQNQLYTTNASQFFGTIYRPSPYPAIGILLDGSLPGPTTLGVFIKNNLVVGGLWGLSLSSAQPESIAIANNTFYGSVDLLLTGANFQPNNSASVYNNAFVQLGYSGLISVPSNLLVANNGFYRIPPGASLGKELGNQYTTSDPQFVSSSPVRGDDFALQATSPYIGAGQVLMDVKDDLFGHARNQTNDIGAIQK